MDNQNKREKEQRKRRLQDDREEKEYSKNPKISSKTVKIQIEGNQLDCTPVRNSTSGRQTRIHMQTKKMNPISVAKNINSTIVKDY